MFPPESLHHFITSSHITNIPVRTPSHPRGFAPGFVVLSVPLEYKYNKANKILKKSAWPWQGGNDKGDTTTVRTLSPGLHDAEASVTTTKGRRDSGFTFPYFKQHLPIYFFFSFYFKKASISQRSRSCTLLSCNFVTAHSQCCEEQLLSPCHLPAEELTRKYNLFCHYSEDKKKIKPPQQENPKSTGIWAKCFWET